MGQTGFKSPLFKDNKRQMQKEQAIPPSPRLDQLDGQREQVLNIQDQYIKNIRYGITSIDTNMDLKRFITKQNDKKNLQNDQT